MHPATIRWMTGQLSSYFIILNPCWISTPLSFSPSFSPYLLALFAPYRPPWLQSHMCILLHLFVVTDEWMIAGWEQTQLMMFSMFFNFIRISERCHSLMDILVMLNQKITGGQSSSEREGEFCMAHGTILTGVYCAVYSACFGTATVLPQVGLRCINLKFI